MTSTVEPARTIRVGLLGYGAVGSEVGRLLVRDSDELAHRVGAEVVLAGVAVRSPRDGAELPFDADLLTTDAHALVTRGDLDVVIELIGGIDPARALVLAALESGASVVTGNKALLAAHGAELFAAAERAGRDLYYEAAVAGAIPIVRPLRESLAGDHVHRVLGIVNGTTNFILDAMTTTGQDFATALAEAQRLGFAEADPSADVEGDDAAAKAAILASLAFHTRVTRDDVHCEGITAVTADDIASATEMGCVVKLLAICERSEDGTAVSARVHPVMIDANHPLAGVRGAFNAVFVETEFAGRLMFYGQGAGGTPTASAVLGDLVTVARHRLLGITGTPERVHAGLGVIGIGQARTRYHLSLDVDDKSGVLASVATTFAENEVSISAVRQEGRGDDAQLVVITHTAPDEALSRTVRLLRDLPMVRDVSSVMRVEGESK